MFCRMPSLHFIDDNFVFVVGGLCKRGQLRTAVTHRTVTGTLLAARRARLKYGRHLRRSLGRRWVCARVVVMMVMRMVCFLRLLVFLHNRCVELLVPQFAVVDVLRPHVTPRIAVLRIADIALVAGVRFVRARAASLPVLSLLSGPERGFARVLHGSVVVATHLLELLLLQRGEHAQLFLARQPFARRRGAGARLLLAFLERSTAAASIVANDGSILAGMLGALVLVKVYLGRIDGHGRLRTDRLLRSLGGRIFAIRKRFGGALAFGALLLGVVVVGSTAQLLASPLPAIGDGPIGATLFFHSIAVVVGDTVLHQVLIGGDLGLAGLPDGAAQFVLQALELLFKGRIVQLFIVQTHLVSDIAHDERQLDSAHIAEQNGQTEPHFDLMRALQVSGGVHSQFRMYEWLSMCETVHFTSTRSDMLHNHWFFVAHCSRPKTVIANADTLLARTRTRHRGKRDRRAGNSGIDRDRIGNECTD